ncbi:MAG TPA: energy-coupling factor transporter transmembrane component T [Methylomusa anaerophila]|uniref:Energy-coupling factor transporter transmembrane protein EcfT n=1 Tax=Methylomusa anaerophila TaxID=1930071 RepID=A0A348AHH2_9FIRM|nr:energy-coupling factor transporter transmembrane component T [Methylomusa anaerophila]BBB90520.1 energy-coupling factor transporter transmembrane protein EcfT [Methylomusa anaerophila]HML89840.1 energy-coupling factor transporter transmembrane component T [Methylomusa anaerophila]
MPKLAPLTKIILTAVISVWALLIQSVPGLALLVGGQILLLALYRAPVKTYQAVAVLALFSLTLVGMQYVFGGSLEFSIMSGLKMMAMSVIFVFLLATTRIQDLTAALVSQCRIPYEYAFMFTAALRFVPDFLAESQAVREAQACRGYVFRGNPLKRLLDYVAIVEPLVLKAITRSETMAMSLELRGFGSRGRRQFTTDVALAAPDYAAFGLMVAVTVGLIAQRYLY